MVFATSHLGYAVLFTFAAPHKGKRPSIRFFSCCSESFIVVCNNKELWEKYDTGGYVHVVPSDNFYVDLGFKQITREKWMSQAYNPEWGSVTEWVTKEKTPVLYAFKIDSTLDALLHLGVQMFFVSEELFDEFKNIKDKALLSEFMKSLTSENEKLGINFHALR